MQQTVIFKEARSIVISSPKNATLLHWHSLLESENVQDKKSVFRPTKTAAAAAANMCMLRKLRLVQNKLN